jgi:peptide/nickel transport system ATP-binding protein
VPAPCLSDDRYFDPDRPEKGAPLLTQVGQGNAGHRVALYADT